MTWPRRDGDWGPDLGPVEHVFARLASEISLREWVLIVVADTTHRAHVRGLIAAASGDIQRVRFQIAPSNDSWARDHGPIIVRTPAGLVAFDFTFNGWGGKYAAGLDNRINRTLVGNFDNVPMEPVSMVLEGGSIDSDGAGTLLTTRRCLLHPGRNAKLTRATIGARLRELLGIERIVWLEHGALAGDDTDSHIDTLARFADPGTIIYQACANRNDYNYSELNNMAHELESFYTRTGAPYRLVPLPSPRPINDANGGRLPAGYANFLIINGAVLVPAYDDPADNTARDVIARCFPGREIVSIDCLPLIRQFGSLHCTAMQLPASVLV